MSIAAAIFIIAIGAILRYATNINVEGVDFDTVGLIMMIAGAVGLVLSFVYEMFWARRRRQEAALAAQQQRQAQQPYQGQGQQQPYEQQRDVREPPGY